MNHPRWLRFSLRTLLLLTAVVACWLGVQVNKARKQRAAVAAIWDAGGTVMYDWYRDWALQKSETPFAADEPPKPGPDWLGNLIGNEYFQKVVGVLIEESEIRPEIVSHLRNLRSLEQVVVEDSGDVRKIQEKLPGVRVLPAPAGGI